MRILLFILILIIVLIAGSVFSVISYLSPEEIPPRIPAPSSARTISTGDIIGIQGGADSHAWLGIPYAEPPVNDLRWKAPRPARPWTSSLETLEFGSLCTQLPVQATAKDLPIGSEDCLSINVWAPSYHPDFVPTGSDRRPVMVWIHGGGNVMGGTNRPIEDGALFAAEQQVLRVSFNYRLGPMGWFRHDVLGEEGGFAEDASGNYGTLDQIMALRWVRRNISAFGGDPNNVTILGSSAGGANVLALMASPLAQGLFHRAIVQGGVFRMTDVSTAENLVDDAIPGDPYSSGEIIVKLMRRDGLAADRQTAKERLRTMNKQDLARYLRSKTPAELFSAYDLGYDLHPFGILQVPKLFGDGYVLPGSTDPQQIFSDVANYNEVPIILGANRDEIRLFMMNNPELTDTRFGLPVGVKNVDAYERFGLYGGEAFNYAMVDELADTLRSAQGNTVWAYRFDVDDLRNFGVVDLKQLMGAAHGVDTPFSFGNFTRPNRVMFPPSMQEEFDIVSTSLMSYWAGFAYTGEPGTGHTEEEILWTPWGDEGNTRIVFDIEDDGGVRMVSDRYSISDIKKRFREDRQLAAAQKCRMYPQLFWFSSSSGDLRDLGCDAL